MEHILHATAVSQLLHHGVYFTLKHLMQLQKCPETISVTDCESREQSDPKYYPLGLSSV